jgi:phosphatidylserine/phosphatidylglycerophosphate/cardiolipin synthase-like enzyme
MRNLDAVPAQKDFSLYTGEEYFAELQKNIAETQPGDRVAVMTLSIDPTEPLVQDTLYEMNRAAERGVNTLLAVDAYALMIRTNGIGAGPHLSPICYPKAVFDERQREIDALNAKPSGKAGLINQPKRPFTNPYGGRSHLKGASVNDRVYLGGPNLHGTTRIDAVVGLEDGNTADWFYNTTKALITCGTAAVVLGQTDRQYKLDETTHFSVDAGQPDQSDILEQALERIVEAEDWLFHTNQFVPNGKVAKELIAANRRGVNVQLAYSNPSKWGVAGGALQRLVLAKQQRQAREMFAQGKMSDIAPSMHAKVLASEKGAMIGTHNLSDAGVKFGTPEIALFSNSPGFSLALRTLLMQQIELAERSPANHS